MRTVALATAFGLVGCASGTNSSIPSFEAFIEVHSRSYQKGTVEYKQRKQLYEERAASVLAHNSRADRRWTAGINRLSDQTEEELQSLRGWDGSVRPGHSSSHNSRIRKAFLQKAAEESLEDLPEEKSWLNLETAKHIRNQGGCGSCWAISASTVLEAHSEIHGQRRSFSAQEIVSCTPNPRECGGSGKCGGATAELAMDYVLKNGVSEEFQVPYTGEDGQCGAKEANPVFLMDQMLGNSGNYAGAAFGMTGWEMLPKNEQEPLMRALVERGPVAVSVGASDWSSYESGIFDGCSKDSIIDHAVTMMAYGKEASSGTKFWLIQNSWGKDWGEEGHIRLLRHDDASAYCGTDDKPEVGTACKGETEPVPVCGMCGVLFDSVVPHFS
eukprot:TRINITY_DN4372_c0_g1_i2.p1 TRINITY_DN4372_c0_g1~~TRINITY_DN4372_c0_g1_i2.p1  ORF type:complete len:385 (-),score=92.38 TRINITY_DN4372_c0_g1_i2:86-1240(-)